MATTPRQGDKLPNHMHIFTSNSCTHVDPDGHQCGHLVSNYYSYDTLMCSVCQVHGVIYSNTQAYGPTTRRHQTWIAAHFSEYAAKMNDADVERKQATGRVTKKAFTSLDDAIA